MNTIRNIAIIGSGNVANFMAFRFFSSGFHVLQVISRNEDSGRKLAMTVSAEYSSVYKLDERVELALINVSDDQIPDVVKNIGNTEAMVCHTAGSIGIDVMSGCKRYGVLYPLQSISEKLSQDTRDIPFLIEASSPDGLKTLKGILDILGFRSSEADSHLRLHYHLAAVFVNNFTNAMVVAAEEIAQRDGLDFSLLKPLLFQTFEKLKLAPPSENQTGPARRNDMITIQKHMDLLKDDPVLAGIYRSATEYISRKFRH